MTEPWMAIGDHTGYDMFQILHQRLVEEYGGDKPENCDSARIAATTVLVASVLRDPIARGVPAEQVIGFAMARLREMARAAIAPDTSN